MRRYDGAKYAVVSSEGRTFDQVTGELVRKLLMYIGGSNEQGKKTKYTDGSVCYDMFTNIIKPNLAHEVPLVSLTFFFQVSLSFFNHMHNKSMSQEH